jgi:cardiolipin synthase
MVSIPNIITFGRILAVPLAVYLILSGDMFWAFWLFVAASLSDALDGAIARMFRSRTVLGGYLDPIADKALLVSVYVALGQANALPLWLVILVVFRDVMIVGGVLLLYTLKESLAMQPAYISKINTAVQLALAAAILAPAGLGLEQIELFGMPVVPPLVWLCAATTLASGVAYVYRGGLLFNRHGGAP